MNAHAAAHDGHDQAHTGGAKYVQIAVILFVLTALEVLLYEVSHDAGPTGFGAFLASNFVVILLALSALKFWYVVMFYMHLKSDIPALRYVFAFSLFIAIVVIVALFILFTYNRTLWWWSGAWK
jgi:cytochrome c oxidase subunit IV